MAAVMDRADPHGLLKILICHGICVTPIGLRSDLYTATCPYGTHPATVDVLARHRERLMANPILSAVLDVRHPQWRTREEWQPAFQLRPRMGLFCCFGCGAFGRVDDLSSRLTTRREPG